VTGRTRTRPARTARVRLTPDERRTQLLDLGVRLLAHRSLDELSIDLLAEEAGISRGLLYHYFGGKQAFHEAVVRHAADELIARTAPPAEGDPLTRLAVSMTAYVEYVEANHEGYLSLVKGAQGGNEALRAIYDEARSALTDRIFTEDGGVLVPDTPATRLLVRGWSALTEEVVLRWVADPAGVSREELLELIAASLPALVGAIGEG
jgi:AcrR family transcriptional regulator